ncbi:hypothetical protein QRX25_14945 [Bacillus sp. L381]|uniref:hypothetical protein n=1 Tax=Bacillus TaxID=1386 RepID=UPI001BADA0CD|nr:MULTISPECIES: hypothetical protein [Bacillus]MCR9040800.1 hypothetical protein [Bacillus velezensis]QUN08779.1 hypothetical protein KEF49_14745 [Bacillus amyloliquefaciens]QYM81851.1 hypothetical protein KTJ85_14590 [Bacillus sp. 7D3]QZY10997.1 hypothetical protein K7B13_14845 [Bacillus amyloliquefaciens]WIX20898.1 hypothetical protein QRX25_14945 [Bacillus sp. L381]
MKTEFTFGDIVSVAGYENRIFYVDAWREVKETDEWGVSEYVEFELTDAINGEFLDAFETDLRLVCRKQFAEDYLLTYDVTNYPEPTGTEIHIADIFPTLPSVESVAELGKGLKKVASNMAKKKAQEVAKEIDGLLDEYNDYMRLHEAFGDAEYKTKADAIMTKLRREAGE